MTDMTDMTEGFSLRHFANATDYLAPPFAEGWELTVVEFESKLPFSVDMRLALRHSAIEIARSRFPQDSGGWPINDVVKLSFFFLVVECFEGLGAKFRFLKRSMALRSDKACKQRILSRQGESRSWLSYSVIADQNSIDTINSANAAIGLVCADGDFPDDADLHWAIDNVSENLVRAGHLMDVGMPAIDVTHRGRRKLFCFSGEFDDCWSSLWIFGRSDQRRQEGSGSDQTMART